MKKIIILLIMLCGCNKPIYEQVTVDEALKIINEPNTIILDVRESNEYNKGHLKNSINIPFDEIATRFQEEVTSHKDTAIVIYCQSGHRAMIAAETLANLGFKNIYTFGSIDDWKYEIVG